MEEATQAAPRSRLIRLDVGIAMLVLAFATLAALVANGHFDGLDRYGVEHWMPGLKPESARHTIPPVEGVFLPFELDPSPWWKRLLDTAMYPASILVSITVFSIGCWVLWRRGQRAAAVVWGAGWFVVNAIEVGVKWAVAKPPLFFVADGTPFHLRAFDHSFPSGHMVRAILLTAFVLYVWRRAGLVLLVWACVMPVCLVAASWHVPSDVIGGLVFGVLAVLCVYAAIAALSARRT
jgi:membrane-associated phospholipid phosphatase